MNDFAAGWLGGVSGITIGYPFDTIKVKQQLGNLPLRGAIRSVSLPRLFDGLMSPVSSYGLLIALNFGTYGVLQRKLSAWLGGADTAATHAVAGALSGSVLAVASSPFELVKIRMQSLSTRTSSGYSSTWACARDVVRKEGIWGGLYKGVSLRANVATLSLGSAWYFSSYQWLQNGVASFSGVHPDALTLGQRVLVGGVTGVAYWGAIYGMDTIKSRLMQDTANKLPRYGSISQCVRETIQERGFVGLYRGVTICLIRAFPVNAVMLSTNYYAKKWLN